MKKAAPSSKYGKLCLSEINIYLLLPISTQKKTEFES